MASPPARRTALGLEIEEALKEVVEMRAEITISVYMDDGRVFDYQVSNAASAREHASAIIKTGYRHSDKDVPDTLEHYPPHRILKVKMKGPGLTTSYYDSPRGT